MKIKKAALAAILLLLTLFAACNSYDNYAANYNRDCEEPPPFESSIPLDTAAAYFAKMQAIWDEDGGALWGLPLHAPLMFADPITRHAVANMPDPDGFLQRQEDVYVGVLPGDVSIGATIVNFNGLLWGMLNWDFAERNLDNEADILRVLTHEGFHAVQNMVVSGFPMGGNLEHMSRLDARISVMLELTALMAAARGSGDEQFTAIHDALSIRYDRRQRHPEAIIGENHFEISEGLAVFTDLMLVVRNLDEILDYIENKIAHYAERQSLRFFGYWSGALYALLLEEVGADWKSGITYGTDLGYLLQQRLGFTELTPFEQLNLGPYGYTEIVQAQTAWIENFESILEGAGEALINQPTLSLGGGHYINWDTAEVEVFFLPCDNPMEVLELFLVIYGNFTVTGTNWQLEVQGGYARILSHPDRIRVGPAINIEVSEDGSRAIGPTWELVITDDLYTIETLPDGRVIIAR